MRASLLLLAGAGVLAGVGLIARPDERAPADGRIVVVRGGATTTDPHPHLVSAAVSPAQEPTAGSADPEGEFGDPGIWATPAEFDRPEIAD